MRQADQFNVIEYPKNVYPLFWRLSRDISRAFRFAGSICADINVILRVAGQSRSRTGFMFKGAESSQYGSEQLFRPPVQSQGREAFQRRCDLRTTIMAVTNEVENVLPSQSLLYSFKPQRLRIGKILFSLRSAMMGRE